MKSKMFSLIMTLILVLSLFGVAVQAPMEVNASANLDQSYEPAHDGGSYANDKAQTFTVGISGTLVRVDVKIVQPIDYNDLLFDVRSTSGGVPVQDNALALVNVRIPATQAPSGYDAEWFPIDFSSSGVPVTAGQVLAMVLRSDPDGTTYAWGFTQADGYPHGQSYYRGPPAYPRPDWFGGTPDFCFRTYVVPEVTTYDLNITVAGSGTTTPAAGTHSYPSGEVVNLTTTPDAGWEFAGWSGDITDASATTQITIDANKAITATFTPTTCYVATTGDDTNDGSQANPWQTIQHAVSTVPGGSTINVAAGNYDSFTVDSKQNLSIVGATGATVTTATSFSEDGTEWGVMAVVQNSTDISIQGLDFDGAVTNVAILEGIAIIDSTANIANLTVSNINGTEMAMGIIVWGLGDGNTDVAISGVTVENSTTAVMIADADVALDSCNIYGKSPNGGYGLNIYDNATVTMTNSTISDCWLTDPQPGNSGIAVMVGLDQSYEMDMLGHPERPCSLEMSGSTISNNNIGIFVDDDGDLTAHSNNIAGNDAKGVFKINPPLVNATNNWWGNASGPTHDKNPGGIGDGVNSNVYYRPWLDAAYPGGQPVTLGSISGYVYKADGTTAIGGATVKVFDYAQQYPLQGPPFSKTTTDANGYYTMNGLSTGDYRVIAVAPGRQHQAYQNTLFWEEAQAVSVTEGSETPNINFTLGPGGAISGTVTNQDTGIPLSQVTVWARYPDGKGVAVTLTDKNGNYILKGLPYGTYLVASPAPLRQGSNDDNYVREYWQEKTSPDMAEGVSVSEGVNPTGINFTLQLGGSISGNVNYFDGENFVPIADARVHPDDYTTGQRMERIHTDASGNYTLVVPTGSYKVYIHAYDTGLPYATEYYNNKYIKNNADPVPVTAELYTPDINFTLELGGTISGTVYEADGETPIDNVHIQAFKATTTEHMSSTDTDSEGHYTLSGLPAGSYLVKAWAAQNSLNYTTEWHDNTYFSSQATAVTVTPLGDTLDINFNLETGGTISGIVTDESQQPIANVPVYALDYETGEWMDGTDTDASGNYTLMGLPTGTYRVQAKASSEYGLPYADEFYADTYSQSEATSVSVTMGQDTLSIDFSLVPGGSISGTVKNADGFQTMAGMHVHAERVDGTGGWGTCTSSDGTYTLGGLPYGQYHVYADSESKCGGATGYLREYWQETTGPPLPTPIVTVGATPQTGINFTLETGGTISGYVYQSDGTTPISGARIDVNDYDSGAYIGSGTTDEYGHYVTSALPTGWHRVRVRADGYATEWSDNTYFKDQATAVGVTAPDDTTNTIFSLEQGGSIPGYVYQSDGQTAIPNARIEAYDSATGLWITGADSDSDGHYTLSGLPAGSYLVRAIPSKRGLNYAAEWHDNVYFRSQATAVTVTPPGDMPNINFSLDVGGTVSGIVTDESQQPIANVHVYATDYGTNEWMSGTDTDANGSYTLMGLPTGTYRVMAKASQYGLPYADEFYADTYRRDEAASVSVTMEQDTLSIDFSLVPGGSISGTVKNADGFQTMAGMHVHAEGVGGTGGWGTCTSSDGTYTLNGLPYGQYHVYADSEGNCGGAPYYIREYWLGKTSDSEADIVTISSGVNPTGINFTLEPGGSISGTVLDQGTGELLNDASSGSIELDVGWHKFVYRQDEWEGGQASRAAFKAPADTDWRWFSTPELHVKVSLDAGADDGLLLITKKNVWASHPTNHEAMVKCVDQDSLPETGWYGQSVVNIVNQNVNIHGNDDYYTSYYEAYFYVDTLGTWYFSTDSDDASEVVIDEQVVAYWYSGHGSANRWEHKGKVKAQEYESGNWGNDAIIEADGSYTIHGLPAGSYRVQAMSPGYISEYFEETPDRNQSAAVAVTVSNDRPNINFTMEPGGSISGYVYQSDGQTPIEGVRVNVFEYDSQSDSWSQMGSGPSDGNGYYQTSLLPAGNYYLRIFAPGYLSEFYDGAMSPNEATTVPVITSQDTSGVNFTLEPGGTVSGYVYQSDGETPIPGARINVIDYDSLTGQWMQLGWATASDNGYYKTTGLPNGDYAVQVKASGYATEWYDNTHFKEQSTKITITSPADNLNIDFTLEQGSSISGTVTDESQQPIANVHIQAFDAATNQHMESTDTDSNGSYTLGGLPTGSFQVRAYASYRSLDYANEWYDDTYFRIEATEVTVTASDDTTNINFSLVSAGSISGHVYQSDGTSPIIGASITVFNYSAIGSYGSVSTDENGYYQFNGLAPGEYAVRVNAGGYASEWYSDVYIKEQATAVTVTAPNDTQEIDFSLVPGGTISGSVVSTATGLGISGALIRVYGSDGFVYGGVRSLPDGSYTTTGLLAGDYTVWAEADGHAGEWYDSVYDQNAATPVTVTVPGNTQNINFSLESGVAINAPADVAPGCDFTATVDINHVENLDAASYTVSFDATVLRLDNVTSGLIGETVIPVDMYNEPTPGTCIITQNIPGLTGVTGSGYLAVLHFHIIGSHGSSSNISPSDGTLSNNEAVGISVVWSGDTVYVSIRPGDANGDGNINALDITKVERIIVGLDAMTYGSDANQDGSVNAIDITKVERLIAGLD